MRGLEQGRKGFQHALKIGREATGIDGLQKGLKEQGVIDGISQAFFQIAFPLVDKSDILIEQKRNNPDSHIGNLSPVHAIMLREGYERKLLGVLDVTSIFVPIASMNSGYELAIAIGVKFGYNALAQIAPDVAKLPKFAKERIFQRTK